jgi:hypothetical protein
VAAVPADWQVVSFSTVGKISQAGRTNRRCQPEGRDGRDNGDVRPWHRRRLALAAVPADRFARMR